MDNLLKKYISLKHAPFHREDWGSIVVWQFDDAVKGTRVYFTTRVGGVSERPYRSLNLGFHVNDSRSRVLRNRELLGGQFGFTPGQLTSPRQRHTATVKELEREQDVGIGSDGEGPSSSPFDACDGLVTAMEQRPLLLHFADCVPVVITARSGKQPLLAVIHAGRAGLMEGVLVNGVERLKQMQASAEGLDEVAVAIGPSIGPCCYEVDASTASGFAARFGDAIVANNHLDLRAAAILELEHAGIGAENISTLDICTCCDQHFFFSYRRDGVTGRQGALAWLG
jgi:hypothetical protein